MNSINFSEDSQKALSRAYNLEQVRRCTSLFDDEGSLLADWIELAGAQAPTYQLLKAEGLIGRARGRFIGVDQNEEIFRSLCDQFGEEGPDHVFIRRRLETVLRNGRGDTAGVVNFDSYNLADRQPLKEQLEIAWRHCTKQGECLGSAALIINAGLDRGTTVENFVALLREIGSHEVRQEDLDRPGVLYGDGRPGHRSRRINYAVLFGSAIDQ